MLLLVWGDWQLSYEAVMGDIMVVLAGLGLPRLLFSHYPLTWIPSTTELRKGLELIDRELKGSSTVEGIVETGRENVLYEPRIMNKIEALGHFAENYRNKAGAPFVG